MEGIRARRRVPYPARRRRNPARTFAGGKARWPPPSQTGHRPPPEGGLWAVFVAPRPGPTVRRHRPQPGGLWSVESRLAHRVADNGAVRARERDNAPIRRLGNRRNRAPPRGHWPSGGRSPVGLSPVAMGWMAIAQHRDGALRQVRCDKARLPRRRRFFNGHPFRFKDRATVSAKAER